MAPGDPFGVVLDGKPGGLQNRGFGLIRGGPHTEGRQIAPGSIYFAALLQAGLRCAQGTQNYEAQPRKNEAQLQNPAAQSQNHEARRLQGPWRPPSPPGSNPRSLAPSQGLSYGPPHAGQKMVAIVINLVKELIIFGPGPFLGHRRCRDTPRQPKTAKPNPENTKPSCRPKRLRPLI